MTPSEKSPKGRRLTVAEKGAIVVRMAITNDAVAVAREFNVAPKTVRRVVDEANEPRPRVEPANAVDVERERWVAQAQTAAVTAMNGIVPPRIPQHPDDAIEPYVPRAIALPVTLPAFHQHLQSEMLRLASIMAHDEGARLAFDSLREAYKVTGGLLLAVAAYGVQIDDVRPEPDAAQSRGDAGSIATEGEAVE